MINLMINSPTIAANHAFVQVLIVDVTLHNMKFQLVRMIVEYSKTQRALQIVRRLFAGRLTLEKLGGAGRLLGV